MTGRVLGFIAAAVVGVVALCSGLVGAVFLGGGSAGTRCAPTAGVSVPAGGRTPMQGWSGEQVANAATITGVGVARGIPLRGWIIAVATAMQESSLINLAGGDRDSVGLFQQRPSQGWGTPEQLHDPVYAAGRFYDKLLTIPNWQTLPLTEAAQAVQISATPEAFATWEQPATLLVSTITGLVGPSGNPMLICAGPGGPWIQPVIAPIVSGFRTAERPTHDGVDFGAARGTPIRAASAGTVSVVRCNITDGYSCDVDGSPQVTGCGWYVDLDHGSGIVTRYCHMLTHPVVEVGQRVAVGNVIGLVGSSGNSSGPHLHFETHVGGPDSSTAQDPVWFMASVGAPIA